jgi:hypothetical protein
MVKARDGTDSVESFEMEAAEEESEEEEEDEVFVKKGRHGSENGSAKKPLIKGSKREKKRNGAMHTEIRTGGGPSDLTLPAGKPHAKRCCGPVCCAFLVIKSVSGCRRLMYCSQCLHCSAEGRSGK